MIPRRRPPDDKLRTLDRCDWVHGAAEEHLRWLGRTGELLSYDAGATVAEQVPVARWVFAVIVGAVAVDRPRATRGAGSFLTNTHGRLIAAAPSEILVIPAAEVAALVRRFPRAESRLPSGDGPQPSRPDLPAGPRHDVSGASDWRQTTANEA